MGDPCNIPPMPTSSLQPRKQIYSVSELNRTIRQLLEREFPLLWIEGEISNLAQPASGHIYFTLKDSQAQVRCAMFKGRLRLVRFKPENGQQVLIRAKVGLYEQRGDFQLIAEHMEEAGDGALQREFEALKARLAQAGLFDESNKRPLPQLPEKIGIITSASGAAIRDVLSVLKRRFPSIPILIYPVLVQGDNAPAEIIKAIKLANAQKRCDVLLLVRGGGSLEDLWAFNNEALARQIVKSKIPVVSGVGHEVDVTIADFAADLRAPTPSAAAELVSPDQQAYIDIFTAYQQRLEQLIEQKLQRANEQLGWLKTRLQLQHPSQQLQQYNQRLDDSLQRLGNAWNSQLQTSRHRYEIAMQRLLSQQPSRQLSRHRQQLENLIQRLKQSIGQQLQQKNQRLAASSHALHIISPLQTLGRGYALVMDSQGNILHNSQQVRRGDDISIRLHQGSLLGKVEKIIKS